MITFIPPTVRRAFLLVILSFLAVAVPALAQNAPLVALVNSGGQLLVSSGDGTFRWIVTNPGETLVGDFVWSPSGDQLFFAVNTGSAVSLRAASIAQQSVSELGQAASGMLTLSPDGNFAFTQQPDGTYSIVSSSGGSLTLPITNDAGARYTYTGVWSQTLPFAAYWGYAGNSKLAVTNAANGQTVLVDSGRTSPVLPLHWVSGTASLIYRDSDGQIRIANFGCLQSQCSGSPADLNVRTLATADADIATDNTHLYFRSANSIAAVPLACASADNCLTSAVPLATNAVPQTSLSASNGVLLYTAYAQDLNNSADREVRAVNLACIASGGCSAQTIITSAIAGALSPNGRFAVIESSNGLESLDLTTGARAYLSERGAPLTRARWQN